MAIVQHFGYSSLFVTFTANPKWEKIEKKLYSNQKIIDRPDFITCVFYLRK